MVEQTEVQRQFDSAHVEMAMRRAEQTVREFGAGMAEIERNSTLTNDFLNYVDSLLIWVPDPEYNSDAIVINGISVDQPRFRKSSVFKRLAETHIDKAPQGKAIERYYPWTGQYLGYFSSVSQPDDFLNPSEIDELQPEEILGKLENSPHRLHHPDERPYAPGTYDQQRNPQHEWQSADTFVTFREINDEDSFHISIQRMDQVILFLETRFQSEPETSGMNVRDLPGNSEYYAAIQQVRTPVLELMDQFGPRMKGDLRKFMIAAHEIAEKQHLSRPKDETITLIPSGEKFILTHSNGIFKRLVPIERFSPVIFPKKTQYEEQDVAESDYPIYIPALLDYIRSYAPVRPTASR